MWIRKAILLFGLANGALFSALVPLWEGFDEAFHYGYVETLWQTKRLPVLGRALIPADVARSFALAPVSYIVQRAIPGTYSFDQWFALTRAEKEQRREELDRLRPESASGSVPNYEVHHPPLAYAVLAVVDWSLQRAPIRVRVLILRLFAAMLATVALYVGATRLCGALELPEPFQNAALFAIFCSEMLYATIAHVANDWLAVALAVLFFAALAARSNGLRLAVWLAAGLLTKAYFLTFAVAAALRISTQRKNVLRAAVLVITIAGPWYARNVAVYGNVAGTYEEFDGIGIRQAFHAAPKIDWPATAGYLARASIWTGNNSFTSFSRSTLNVELALLAVAFAAWALQPRLQKPGERIVVFTTVLFCIAIAYATCAAFADRNGQTAGASPWYTQVLLAPVFAMAYLGMSRWKRFGRALAAATTAISTWVLIATWTLKLFPMYAGGQTAPMHLRDAWAWWAHQAAAHAQDLSLLALAPAPVLYAGLTVSVTLSLLLSVTVIRSLITS